MSKRKGKFVRRILYNLPPLTILPTSQLLREFKDTRLIFNTRCSLYLGTTVHSEHRVEVTHNGAHVFVFTAKWKGHLSRFSLYLLSLLHAKTHPMTSLLLWYFILWIGLPGLIRKTAPITYSGSDLLVNRHIIQYTERVPVLQSSLKSNELAATGLQTLSRQ